MIRTLVLAFCLVLPAAAGAQTVGLDCSRLAAADRASYNAALQRAGAANAARHYAEAETGYRQALELQVKGCGPTDPAQTFALSHVALQQSNLGRFAEADPLFAQADGFLQVVDPLVRARALHNRALHAANQKHFAEALAIADKAEAAYLDGVPSLDRAAGNLRLVPTSFDRPQRALEERGARLNGKARIAAPGLRALYGSAAYWATQVGDGQRAALYTRRADAVADAIGSGR